MNIRFEFVMKTLKKMILNVNVFMQKFIQIFRVFVIFVIFYFSADFTQIVCRQKNISLVIVFQQFAASIAHDAQKY